MGWAQRTRDGQQMPATTAARALELRGKLAKWRIEPRTYIACLDGRTAYIVTDTGQFRRVPRDWRRPETPA